MSSDGVKPKSGTVKGPEECENNDELSVFVTLFDLDFHVQQ